MTTNTELYEEIWYLRRDKKQLADNLARTSLELIELRAKREKIATAVEFISGGAECIMVTETTYNKLKDNETRLTKVLKLAILRWGNISCDTVFGFSVKEHLGYLAHTTREGIGE